MSEREVNKSILNSLRQHKYTVDAAKLRSIPVTYDDVCHKNPSSILQEYILLWEPRDLRLDPLYQKNHDVTDTDDDVIKDIAKGMKLEVEERIPSQNTIKVAVLFQYNLSEFERYNDVVDAHNEEWIKQGRPVDTFDPETGDIFDIKDRYVNRAGDDTLSVFGKSSGQLAKSAPDYRRLKLLTVTYKLNLIEDDKSFQLEFTAEDKRGKLVYFNTLKGKNLANLTRRATQELYGNPELFGNTGPFLRGISMLVTGKKINRCFSKNEKPRWSTDEYKNGAATQAAYAASASGIYVVGNLIRYVVPIICVLVVLKKTITAGMEGSMDGLFLTYLFCLGVIYASVVISKELLRKAYDLNLEKDFS